MSIIKERIKRYSIKYRGIAYWEGEGVTPPAFEDFVFLNTKSKKSTFSGLFNYSIYLKEDITPTCSGPLATSLIK